MSFAHRTRPSSGSYIFRRTLPPETLDAAYRVTKRMAGNLQSRVWRDEEAEDRDYATLAAQWRWLHPTSDLEDWEAAEAWVRAFRRDVYDYDP